MALAERQANIRWEGDLQTGSGRLSVGSKAFPEQTVTFPRRIGEMDHTTSPEELIAAAHATCYVMGLAATLGRGGTPASGLDVNAVCSLERGEGGLKITAMDLNVRGAVPGLDAAKFQEIAEQAERSCPVSNALRGNVEIRVKAQLA